MSEIFDITSFSLDDNDSFFHGVVYYDTYDTYDVYDAYDDYKCVTQERFVKYFKDFITVQNYYEAANEIIISSYIGDIYDKKKCIPYNLNMEYGIITDKYTQILINNNYIFPSDVDMVKFPSVIPFKNDKKLLCGKDIIKPNNIYDINMYRGKFVIKNIVGGELTRGYKDWVPYSDTVFMNFNLMFYQTFFSQTEDILNQENISSLDGTRVYYNMELPGEPFLRIIPSDTFFKSSEFDIVHDNHMTLKTEKMGTLISELNESTTDFGPFEIEGYMINGMAYTKSQLPRNFMLPADKKFSILPMFMYKTPFVTIYCEGINPRDIEISDYSDKYELIDNGNIYSVLFYGYEYKNDEIYSLHYYDYGEGKLTQESIDMNKHYTVFNSNSSEEEPYHGYNMRVSISDVESYWHNGYGYGYAIPTNVRLRNKNTYNESVAYLVIPPYGEWNNDWREKGCFFNEDKIVNTCFYVSAEETIEF